MKVKELLLNEAVTIADVTEILRQFGWTFDLNIGDLHPDAEGDEVTGETRFGGLLHDVPLGDGHGTVIKATFRQIDSTHIEVEADVYRRLEGRDQASGPKAFTEKEVFTFKSGTVGECGKISEWAYHLHWERARGKQVKEGVEPQPIKRIGTQLMLHINVLSSFVAEVVDKLKAASIHPDIEEADPHVCDIEVWSYFMERALVERIELRGLKDGVLCKLKAAGVEEKFPYARNPHGTAEGMVGWVTSAMNRTRIKEELEADEDVLKTVARRLPEVRPEWFASADLLRMNDIHPDMDDDERVFAFHMTKEAHWTDQFTKLFIYYENDTITAELKDHKGDTIAKRAFTETGDTKYKTAVRILLHLINWARDEHRAHVRKMKAARPQPPIEPLEFEF